MEVCRICRNNRARVVGVVEYVAGYKWKVFDCDDCECRFTRHDAKIYNLLHKSGAISYYAAYRELAAHCLNLFKQQDREGLKAVLCQTPKYRFVIESVEQESKSLRLLEMGCSRGYLASYFLLDGKDVLGVDVSPEAIEYARTAFGDHFAGVGSPRIDCGRPYDVIYHVGMIGCVGDPLLFTKELLGMLKPGGRLLFNAPNRAALCLPGQLWMDSAPPPDVVTLFPEGFWKRSLAEAEVVEGVEMLPVDRAAVTGLRTLCRRRWRKPTPQTLTQAASHNWAQQSSGGWRLFERVVLGAARRTRLDGFIPRVPSDFGLFVQMTAR